MYQVPLTSVKMLFHSANKSEHEYNTRKVAEATENVIDRIEKTIGSYGNGGVRTRARSYVIYILNVLSFDRKIILIASNILGAASKTPKRDEKEKKSAGARSHEREWEGEGDEDEVMV